MTSITSAELNDLLVKALTGIGFTAPAANALSAQTVLAEELGQSSVGVAHVFDYTGGVTDGRIDPKAVPLISKPAPTMIHVNGHGGLPQTGFDEVFEELIKMAESQGVALYLGANAMLCGSLGTFALRLAERGLIALAATNGSPLLAGSGSKQAVFCTNPMAFAAPRDGGPPLLIDQSCSATAYVNIRAAADKGDEIPLGWAIDSHGNPTTDPKAAMTGSLLTFGGARGSNLALMVETLAGGLANANFSIDAAPFDRGDTCPATGLFVMAINPKPVNDGFKARMGRYVTRLANEFSVYIPGVSKTKHRNNARVSGLNVDENHLEKLREMAAL